jgi:tetratricopeptide (TPR) repeat protein
MRQYYAPFLSTFILLIAGCGGAPQVQIEPVSGDDNRRASRSEVAPKPPPVKRQAKDLFTEGVKAFRPEKGSPDFPRAMALFKRAIDEEPTFGAAYFNIAAIHERQGDLKSAADYYRQASTKGKNFPDGLANLGRIMLIQGKLDEA